MILNSGLDAACTNNAAPGSGAAPNQAHPAFAKFAHYAAFGTSSTAPAASDTSLGSQVGSRSIDRGGFPNTENVGLDDTNDVIWYEATYTRVFSIASNVNATEWGLAPASTGNLSVRELFRADPLDNASSPITLTLEAGDELQLVITLRVQATWEYESKSFVITGTAGNDTAGRHTGSATVSSGTSSTVASISGALSACWPGGASASSYENLEAWATDQSSVTKSGDFTGASLTTVPASAAAYTPGAYQRDWSATWGTSQGNGDHYAWLAGSSATVAGASGAKGLRYILTDPAKLTKASTHKLTLTVRKSIARL